MTARSPHGPGPAAVASLVFVLAILWAVAAFGQRPEMDDDMPADQTSRTIEFMAFSKSGREFAVHVKDEMRGESFEVYDCKKTQLIKAYPFDEGGDKKTWRKVKRKHSLTMEAVEGGENPKKGVTVLGNAKDGKLNLFVTNGERIRKYTSIELPEVRIRGKKKKSKGSVKEILFEEKGKYFVVIYHQKVAGTFDTETDQVTSFKFKAYKARFPTE